MPPVLMVALLIAIPFIDGDQCRIHGDFRRQIKTAPDNVPARGPVS
jgi:hypothetical protein